MAAVHAPAAANVRVVTTIGHVDHGKTTLMDALLAANNIISSRMAGKIRYLDSREDEQERGITMESSAVSLQFKVLEKSADGQASSARSYLVNMIDTPGHVDFSSEVSTASRLVDGALVIVDVVEGVCTQTITVLRQAWQDRLRPILVLNKFDRLITELKLSPLEAYHQLSQLIEQVNAVMGSFFAHERMEDDLRWREEREQRLAVKKEMLAAEADASINEENEFQEKDDEDLYFAPERGNVIFASAIDGWGFRVGKFAQLFSAKLGIKEANLRRVLWGDFYLDPKTKRVISHKHLRGRALKPLFVQIVLENIWAVYDAVVINPNPERVPKIVSALDLKISPRELKTRDSRQLLSTIFSQWLSLSACIIQAIIDIVPAPSVAQRTRIARMIYPDAREGVLAPKNKLEEDLFSCNATATSSVVAYVSKMFAVPTKDLPEHKRQAMSADEMRRRAREVREARQAAGIMDTPEASSAIDPDSVSAANVVDATSEGESESVLGFARIYCGTIHVGQAVFAVLPKYNGDREPSHPSNLKYRLKATIQGLYTMMGRELVPVESVQAGNVFAVRGLEGIVWRNATLCAPDSGGVDNNGFNNGFDNAHDFMVNLGALHNAGSPIVRVALEAVSPADMPKLVNGLKLLSQADPCVQTFQQQTGEHVILTAGELHLERCLKDLRERFAKVEIQASKPIVPFRETAVRVHDMLPSKATAASRGTVTASSSQAAATFTIRAIPMPPTILEYILDNISVLRRLQRDRDMLEERTLGSEALDLEEEQPIDVQGDVERTPTVKPENYWTTLQERCQQVGGDWADLADRIWAFGPHGAGGCLLIDSRVSSPPNSLRHRMRVAHEGGSSEIERLGTQEFDGQVEYGFQIATFQGPLCAEPVEGIAYFVQSVEIDSDALEQERVQNRMSQVTGSVITAVKDACRSGLLDWSPRLKMAMYSCDIQASTDVLGKVYGVVAKRRGRITAEEMKEGTSFFTVSAMLPVVESFGFADDIRKRTSGAASPLLIFNGYEMLDLDPFWVPTTEEELEDLGEKSDKTNVAKAYMDAVRERKGMFVDKKIVEFAEKQRTLKR